jgi:hypothetical protein
MRVELANQLLNLQATQLAFIVEIVVQVARRVGRNGALNLLLHGGSRRRRRIGIAVVASTRIACIAV